MDSPNRRARALATFNKRLTIDIVSGTRLIDIGYSSPDPDLAAKVVNTLVTDLAQYSFQTKYKSTQQTSAWLGDQIEAVAARLMICNCRNPNCVERPKHMTWVARMLQAIHGLQPLARHLQQSTLAVSNAQSSRILRAR